MSHDTIPDDPDAGDPLAEVHRKLDALARRLDGIGRAQQRQQELVHRLHEENSRLRRGEVQEALLPLVRHLIDLVDQVQRVADGADEGSAGQLATVQRAILEGLRRSGVEQETLEPGDAFDPERHAAVAPVDTLDADLDGRIAAVHRPPYVRAEDRRMIRHAEVDVHRLVTAPDGPTVGDQAPPAGAPASNDQGASE